MRALPELAAQAAKPAGHIEALGRLMTGVARDLGFMSACYFQLSIEGHAATANYVFGEIETSWKDYVASEFDFIDGLIQSAFRSHLPFTARELTTARADGGSRRPQGGPPSVAAHETLFCPVFGPLGECGALIFLSEDPVELDHAARFYLHVIANTILSIHWSKANPREGSVRHPPHLSPRESECLYWAAQGKSAADTATILGISNHTVREYIDSVMLKLGASNREEMVLRALPLGLLVSHR